MSRYKGRIHNCQRLSLFFVSFGCVCVRLEYPPFFSSRTFLRFLLPLSRVVDFSFARGKEEGWGLKSSQVLFRRLYL